MSKLGHQIDPALLAKGNDDKMVAANKAEAKKAKDG